MSTDDTPREVLARVQAARTLCDAILTEKLEPSHANLAQIAGMLDIAADYARGRF